MSAKKKFYLSIYLYIYIYVYVSFFGFGFVFLSVSEFCAIGPLYCYPISETIRNFSLQFDMTKRRQAFLALWFRKKEETIILAKN